MTNVVYVDFGREERLLNKEQIAKRLGYTVRTVEKLTAEGMPSEIKGIRRMYKETACRNWLAQRERGVANAR